MQTVVTLVVLAGEHRVRLLQNSGLGRGLTEVDALDRWTLEEQREGLEGREAMTGGGQHVFEPRFQVEERQRRLYAEDVVWALTERLASEPFDRLVIAAGTRMLGLLRTALTPELRRRHVFDVERELVDLPPEALAPYFTRGGMF